MQTSQTAAPTLYTVSFDTEAIIAGDFKAQVRLVHVCPLFVSRCGHIVVRAKTCRIEGVFKKVCISKLYIPNTFFLINQQFVKPS